VRYDVVIVGGGPAGIHAALKAAVLQHTALLVDKGAEFSRVSQAQAIANVPFAPGVSGPDLLRAGRRDLDEFTRLSGRRLVDVAERTEAVDAVRDEEGFRVRLRDASGAERDAHGRALVLATGVVDRKPGIDRFHEAGHRVLAPYVRGGQVGYCVLCEGWRLEGKRVAVVGRGDETREIAHDLASHFGAAVTRLAPEEVAALRDEQGVLVVELRDGSEERFDHALFHAGWYQVNNALAVGLGAAVDPEGFVRTSADCEALDASGRVLPGLFAIGDVRDGSWKQVPLAWADAERAIIKAYAARLPDPHPRSRHNADRARTPHPFLMPDADEEPPRRHGGPPEGGSSTLAQRDASGEVEEKDLKPGERRRGGERLQR